MSLFHREKDIALSYDRNADILYRLALSHLQNDSDAQDAVQEAFERYLKHLPSFINEEHERSWLIRVTVNICLDMLRRKKVRAYIPIEEVSSIADEKSGFAESNSVFEMLSKIPEKFRSAIVLHYLEGYSVEQTAKISGISVSATKMRLLRGREALKDLICKEEDKNV